MPTLRRTLTTILLAAMALFLAACSFTENKQAAEQTADTLYLSLAIGDIEGVLDLYSDRFYQETSREDARMFWNTILDRLGQYHSHELISWDVTTQANTQFIGTVTVLVYNVHYSHYDATEELTFLGSSPPQLVGHYVRSDALF
ncbi:MAG: hypothetical protein ACE5K9_06050 [Candidatus Methylomirabilales bacterium]